MAPTRSEACKRKGKRKKPSLEEVVEICHELFVEKMHHSDIAKRHGLTTGAIAQVKYRLKHNPTYLQDLFQKH